MNTAQPATKPSDGAVAACIVLSSLHDQALTGARALDHRTTDAVEILIDKYDEESRWKLLRHLTALDLDATMPLCANLLSELHGQFTKVYRPGANDEPRPYSELLERLGNGEQLPDLIWLAGQRLRG